MTGRSFYTISETIQSKQVNLKPFKGTIQAALQMEWIHIYDFLKRDNLYADLLHEYKNI